MRDFKYIIKCYLIISRISTEGFLDSTKESYRGSILLYVALTLIANTNIIYLL